MKARARSLVPVICLLAAGALLLGGCLDRKLKALNPCLVSGVVAQIAVQNIDKVDLVFMVDNSNSMAQEQASLRREFPKLIRVLTTGDRDGDGMNDFPPAKDLHLGVVSSDLGLAGIEGITNCRPDTLGDDGMMKNTPSPDVSGCQSAYPRFLSYVADRDDAERTATDFACIATLGTGGCGFEQQLESTLKALWPQNDPMPLSGPNPDCPDTNNRICFLGTPDGQHRFGQGDNANRDFLRNDPSEGLSLIGIVMVTDEEDCSSHDTSHFTHPDFLADNDPRKMQDLNLRCFFNKQNLYKVERYIEGFKALRPGNENLVIFAAIAGVPEDLVTPERYAEVDWLNDNERNQFYQRILNDPRMQEVPDPSRPSGQGNLTPSCTSTGGVAYPPIRLVQVAMGFGANGTVHSICQDNLGPAIDAIIEVIARQLGAVCLPRPLVRNSDGLVGCNVVWELPPPGQAPDSTPTRCDQLPFLLPPDPGRETVNDRNGAVCKVAQMAVIDGSVTPADNGNGQVFQEGWFYDDFSAERAMECVGDSKQRIAFTPMAKPPTGVVVKLECLNETQSLAQNRTDIEADLYTPTIGSPCEMLELPPGQRSATGQQVLIDDEACWVRLAQANERWPDGLDKSMFCHPKFNVCSLACQTTADCPAAWVCDRREQTVRDSAKDGNEGTPICVNPTCGDGS